MCLIVDGVEVAISKGTSLEVAIGLHVVGQRG